MSYRFVVAVAVAFASAAGAQQTRPAAPHKAKARHETQAQLQKEATISKDSATAIARATVPNATVKSSELEREGGKLIYSFDMKVAGKSGVEEVNVDAMNGAVIAHEHESAKAEKAEKKAEKAEKKADKVEKKEAAPAKKPR